MKPLSYTMLSALDLVRNQARVTSSTYDALERRGLFDEKGRLTSNGYEFVKEFFANKDSKKYSIDHTLIDNDGDLLDAIMGISEPSIYVYRGTTPMLVDGGDGQNPIATLSGYYEWKIRRGMEGKFLKMHSILGHKGSYGYNFVKSSEYC